MTDVDYKVDLLLEISEAQKALESARQRESLADINFIDLAIEETNNAMERLNILYKKAKLILTDDR